MFVLAGCKPTENNYRKAYDAARAKREAAAAENMLPATGLLSDDGPQLRVWKGDTVFVDRQLLRDAKGSKAPEEWYVAVGVYKMHTNAEANAERLAAGGWKDAAAYKSGGDRWYAVVAGAQTLDSVAAQAREFMRANPDYPYVGLPGKPVLINRY